MSEHVVPDHPTKSHHKRSDNHTGPVVTLQRQWKAAEEMALFNTSPGNKTPAVPPPNPFSGGVCRTFGPKTSPGSSLPAVHPWQINRPWARHVASRRVCLVLDFVCFVLFFFFSMMPNNFLLSLHFRCLFIIFWALIFFFSFPQQAQKHRKAYFLPRSDPLVCPSPPPVLLRAVDIGRCKPIF